MGVGGVLSSYEKEKTVADVMRRKPVYLTNTAVPIALSTFKLVEEDGALEEARRVEDAARLLRTSSQPRKAWGSPNAPETGVLRRPGTTDGASLRRRLGGTSSQSAGVGGFDGVGGNNVTRSSDFSAEAFIKTTSMSPPPLARPHTSGGASFIRHRLSSSNIGVTIADASVEPEYRPILEETVPETNDYETEEKAAPSARELELEDSVRELAEVVRALTRENAELRAAAVTDAEAARVETLAQSHARAVEVVAHLTKERESIRKAAKSQQAQISQLQRALRESHFLLKASQSPGGIPTLADSIKNLKLQNGGASTPQSTDLLSPATPPPPYTAEATYQFSTPPTASSEVGQDPDDLLMTSMSGAGGGDECMPDQVGHDSDAGAFSPPPARKVSQPVNAKEVGQEDVTYIKQSSGSKEAGVVSSSGGWQRLSWRELAEAQRKAKLESAQAAEKEETERKRQASRKSRPPERLLSRAKDAELARKSQEEELRAAEEARLSQTQFRSNPILSKGTKAWADLQKDAKAAREERVKEHAVWLAASASLPPRMALHEAQKKATTAAAQKSGDARPPSPVKKCMRPEEVREKLRKRQSQWEAELAARRAASLSNTTVPITPAMEERQAQLTKERQARHDARAAKAAEAKLAQEENERKKQAKILRPGTPSRDTNHSRMMAEQVRRKRLADEAAERLETEAEKKRKQKAREAGIAVRCQMEELERRRLEQSGSGSGANGLSKSIEDLTKQKQAEKQAEFKERQKANQQRIEESLRSRTGLMERQEQVAKQRAWERGTARTPQNIQNSASSPRLHQSGSGSKRSSGEREEQWMDMAARDEHFTESEKIKMGLRNRQPSSEIHAEVGMNNKVYEATVAGADDFEHESLEDVGPISNENDPNKMSDGDLKGAILTEEE